MPTHLERGRRGEDIALHLLQQKGYQLLIRNYRAGRGEIDLIVQKDEVVVFVEVKTRTNLKYGMPEDSISKKKTTLISATANEFIFATDWKGNIRFDVVSVILKGNQVLTEHFEDAFY